MAILSALETVTAKVPSTIKVAALRKMAGRGGALVDGPLALDNAISPQAAVIKKLAGARSWDGTNRGMPFVEDVDM